VSLVLGNPELVRNARIQLRMGRLLATGGICAAVSVTVGIIVMHSKEPPSIFGLTGGRELFAEMVFFQVVALVIGGGLYCLQTVHREKELNTYDYQRITRLTPLELGLGKLFGAPTLAYFAALCLLPAALIGAFSGHVKLPILLQVYVVVLLGAIAYHAFALLVSLLLERGTVAVAVFLFLLVVAVTSIDFGGWNSPFAIRRLSPFFATELLTQPESRQIGIGHTAQVFYPLHDAIFGFRVPHTIVLTLLYLTFTAWFLWGAVRNLKRDPDTYEIYSPPAAFGFVLYLDLLLVAFFRWEWVHFYPAENEEMLLGITVGFFAVLGLVLLRNRERVRQRVRNLGKAAAGWLSAAWPAPYMFVGSIIAGLAIVFMVNVRLQRGPKVGWDLGVALFDVVFCAVWLARDILYLQWMNLRRTRRPLASAVLYLIVFYVCASVLFSAFDWFWQANHAPYTAFIVPTPLYASSLVIWNVHHNMWILALVLQAIEACFFVYLQRQRLQQLLVTSTADTIAE
jgi:hypothetical protein